MPDVSHASSIRSPFEVMTVVPFEYPEKMLRAKTLVIRR
jgi:hypothetical protein